LVYRIVSPVILAVFALVSCNVFVPPRHEYVETPLRGDVRFVFLDEDFNRIDEDLGILALVIEGNCQADGVWIIADLPYNRRGNGMVTHVISEQDGLFVSVFFDTLRDFPRKMAVTAEGEDIIGEFGRLCLTAMAFSIILRDGYEQDAIENIALDRSNIPLHLCSHEFTQMQNLRLRNIMTTLAIWESMADQIDDEFEARITRRLRSDFRSALAAAATAAAISVVAAFPPVAVELELAAALPQPPVRPGGGHARPEANPDRRPKAMITTEDGREIINNGEPRYLSHGESAVFYIEIIYIADFSIEGIIDVANAFLRFNPGTPGAPDAGIILNGNPFNAQFFDTALEAAGADLGNVFRLTITRNDRTGSMDGGKVHFVIEFRQWMIINGIGEGGFALCQCRRFFQEAGPDQQGGNLFIFNFTALQPQAGNGNGNGSGSAGG